jgi:hypothetical protein
MIFLTSVSRSVSSGIGIGLMLGTVFTGYPFALCEKSNMDALYATLSLSRKTIVTGRYIFVAALNAGMILFASVVSSAGIFISRTFDIGERTGGTFLISLSLALMFGVVQSMQLPLLFKFGYSKAKFFGLIPFCAIMGAYSAITAISKEGGFFETAAAIAAFLTKNNVVAAATVVLVLCLILYISYNLALRFYKKREF